MPRVTDIELVHDRTGTSRCDEGFLRLKRYTARNRREDGSVSREYPIDVIDRPALDAVAVCAYARGPRGTEVLTRAGLRPAALFRRGKSAALPEPEYLLVEEIVAGVLEPGEQGEGALFQRGAAELEEEAGLRVDASRLERLGAAFFMLPGIASEKIHLVAVEVPPPTSPAPHPAPAHGDGSPLEEGAVLRWRPLDDAIRACERGEIEDAKSELAFRRLAARLSRQVRVPRRFSAAPERVFDAWVDPATAARFLFATPTGRMVRVELDPRPGGALLFVDRRDGEDVAHAGEFLEVVRPRRLAFRYSVPKYSAEVTRVTVEIAPLDGGCELTLVHEPVAAEWAARTAEGWKGILDALAVVLGEPGR